MTTHELLQTYGKRYGINHETLRYARNTNKITFRIERSFDCVRNTYTCHFEYDEDDVDRFINDYWLIKGERWRRK